MQGWKLEANGMKTWVYQQYDQLTCLVVVGEVHYSQNSDCSICHTPSKSTVTKQLHSYK